MKDASITDINSNFIDRLNSTIDRFGHAIITRNANEVLELPRFDYTVGLSTSGLPELVLFEHLNINSNVMINELVAQIKAAKSRFGPYMPSIFFHPIYGIVQLLPIDLRQFGHLIPQAYEYADDLKSSFCATLIYMPSLSQFGTQYATIDPKIQFH